MSAYIQLITLLIYNVFGIILSLLLSFIKYRVNNKILISLIFILFILFGVLNYFINSLQVHLYFILSFILGYIFSKIYVNKLKRY